MAAATGRRAAVLLPAALVSERKPKKGPRHKPEPPPQRGPLCSYIPAVPEEDASPSGKASACFSPWVMVVSQSR